MPKLTRNVFVRLTFVAVSTLATEPARSQAPSVDLASSASLGVLRFRYIGPVGNRVAAVAGIAGDANTYYAGAASGGIWKTTDAGIHWSPIFDDQTISSIGALAVAPSSPNIVWAGTGEPWIRSHISIGNGLYKSVDAGRTWTHSGPDSASRTGRIVIDPANPDIVFVAAQGHSYGPEAGTWRLSHDRWRADVEARVVRRRQHRRNRRRDAPDGLENALRRDVAARASHVGTRERRHGERHLRHPRRRRHMDEARGERAADARAREDRPRRSHDRIPTESTRSSKRATAIRSTAGRRTTVSCGVRRTAA